MLDIVRPLLSVAELNDHGYAVHLKKDHESVTDVHGNQLRMHREGGLYVMYARIVKKAAGDCLVMPVQAEAEVEEAPPVEEEELVRSVQEPVLPDEQTQKQHALVHVPFASWCKHCVESKAVEEPHRSTASSRGGELVDELPRCSWTTPTWTS